MSPFFILLAKFGAVFYFRNLIFHAGHVALKRRSKQITFIIGPDFSEGEVFGACVSAPFYQEPFISKWSLGIAGPRCAYKPIVSIPQLFSKIIPSKSLIQLVRGDAGAPSPVPPGLSAEDLQRAGIRFESGYLCYSPTALQNGALSKGLSAETDMFLVVDDFSSGKLSALAARFKQPNTNAANGDLSHFLTEVDATGLVISRSETWWVYSRNHHLIDEFVDSSFGSAYNNLMRIENIRLAPGSKFPRVVDIVSSAKREPDEAVLCEIYKEGSHTVTYVQCGKKKETILTPIVPATPTVENRSLGSVLAEWFLPHVVHDRPYPRFKLFRFALQYLLTAFYLLLACILGADIVDRFGLSPVGYPIQILAAIAIFCSFLAICLSIVYFLRGLFSRRGFVLPGI